MATVTKGGGGAPPPLLLLDQALGAPLFGLWKLTVLVTLAKGSIDVNGE
jgi:hypothetical protein